MCTLLLFLGALGPTETPSALQAMQSASSQVRKSRITFVVTTRAHGAWAEPYYYEYRSAGEQEILKDRGPLSQYGRKDEDGEPLPSPEKWWFYDGKALWSYWGESTGASCSEEEWDVSGRGHLFIPLLQAGSYPYPSTEYNGNNFTAAHGGLAPAYSERELVGGVRQVEARFADGNSYRWWIDPGKGWNCIRCERLYNERIASYCVTEYQQVNGTWVVLAVNYFAEDVPIAQLRTEGTVVNDPTLPDRLTPRDAGLLEGQQVYLRRAGETSSRLWSGTALLDGADFKSMVDAGAARFDPVLREQQRLRRKRAAKAEGRAGGDAAAKGPQSQPAGPSEVDAWIMYAQRFSDDYRLLDEQRATALRVVRQLLPQKQKIVAHTGPLRGSKEPKDVARVREGDLRIQRIFDHELKPRLMKIPTRTQVQEFEKRKLDRNRGAASAPSP